MDATSAKAGAAQKDMGHVSQHLTHHQGTSLTSGPSFDSFCHISLLGRIELPVDCWWERRGDRTTVSMARYLDVAIFQLCLDGTRELGPESGPAALN